MFENVVITDDPIGLTQTFYASCKRLLLINVHFITLIVSIFIFHFSITEFTVILTIDKDSKLFLT